MCRCSLSFPPLLSNSLHGLTISHTVPFGRRTGRNTLRTRSNLALFCFASLLPLLRRLFLLLLLPLLSPLHTHNEQAKTSGAGEGTEPGQAFLAFFSRSLSLSLPCASHTTPEQASAAPRERRRPGRRGASVLPPLPSFLPSFFPPSSSSAAAKDLLRLRGPSLWSAGGRRRRKRGGAQVCVPGNEVGALWRRRRKGRGEIFPQGGVGRKRRTGGGGKNRFYRPPGPAGSAEWPSLPCCAPVQFTGKEKGSSRALNGLIAESFWKGPYENVPRGVDDTFSFYGTIYSHPFQKPMI